MGHAGHPGYVICRKQIHTENGTLFAFLDIEQPNALQHTMFKEDTTTAVPMKLTRKEKQENIQQQGQQDIAKTKKSKVNQQKNRRKAANNTRTGHELLSSGEDGIEIGPSNQKNRHHRQAKNGPQYRRTLFHRQRD